MEAKKPRRFRRWLRRAVFILMTVVAFMLLVGGLWQNVADYQANERYQPPGKFVTINDRQVHYLAEGQGDPAVVFISGFLGAYWDWQRQYSVLAKETRVFAYDRPGLGFSESAKTPRTPEQIVTELRQTLQATNVPPPYVLVGHSLGGQNARLFASLYPHEVQGLVLLDAVNTDTFPTEQRQAAERVGPLVGESPLAFDFLNITRHFGTPRLVWPNFLFRRWKDIDDAEWERLTELRARASVTHTAWREVKALSKWRETRDKMRHLGSMPVAILSARSRYHRQWWSDAQQALTQISDNVRHSTLRSSHAIMANKPEEVLQAIEWVLSEVRDAGHSDNDN